MKRLLFSLFILGVLTCSASAANRFGICPTTCTWDASSTAMWSTSSGGATGASVPGSVDSVIFDAATCTGGTTCTITVNTNPSIANLTMGACTASTTGCILDFSVNNNNITICGQCLPGGSLNVSGTGVRTLKMGSGTWTVTGTGNLWFGPTATNMTLTPGTSNLILQSTGTAGADINTPSGTVFGHVTINTFSSLATAGPYSFGTNSSSFTIGTLDVIAPNIILLPNSPSSLTVSNAIHWTASGTNTIRVVSSGANQGLITVPAGSTINQGTFNTVAWTGATTATNSFEFGRIGGTGLTVTGPTGSGAGACILGGWLLWRDITPDQHNNLPAFLDQAA